MREVVILGVGLHPFGWFGEKNYTELGRVAILDALRDAGVKWKEVEAAFCGNVSGDAGGHLATTELVGFTGIPVVRVENACSSGSSALRLAYQSVAAGFYDIAMAFGFEKWPRTVGEVNHPMWQREMGIGFWPPYYGVWTRRYMEEYQLTLEQLAKIVVKNRQHGSLNTYAYLQKPTTVEEILCSRVLVEPLTRMMVAARTHGGAAAVLCAKSKAKKYTTLPIIIAASVLTSPKYQRKYIPMWPSKENTEWTAKMAYELSGIGPEDLDLAEIHDPMPISEIEHSEALGLCKKGEYPVLLEEGKFAIGGKLPINPDGGIVSFGHPYGATGLRQIAEVVWQLRDQAGERQIKGAKVGATHTLGAGGNTCITILKK